MAIFNAEERKAGTLILDQFKMFNEAVVFFEQYLQPAFDKGFDHCFEHIAKQKDWDGEYEFNKKSCIWFAPKHWQIDKKEWKYWFETHYSPDEGIDYRLSIITNTSSRQEKFGIRFTVNSGWIGGNKYLNEFSKNISSHHITQLQELGFINHGKGNFFLPLMLDIGQVTTCWQEHAAFPIEHDVFTPINELMDKLEQSTAIFDEIFASANSEKD